MKRNAQQIIDLIQNDNTVYSATFIFQFKNYDSEFENLNEAIDKIAHSNSGFLGKERWFNDGENKQSVIYYWNSMEQLKKFSKHPDHQKAKNNYNKWYSGYEIIISEVIKFKTDGGLL